MKNEKVPVACDFLGVLHGNLPRTQDEALDMAISLLSSGECVSRMSRLIGADVSEILLSGKDSRGNSRLSIAGACETLSGSISPLIHEEKAERTVLNFSRMLYCMQLFSVYGRQTFMISQEMAEMLQNTDPPEIPPKAPYPAICISIMGRGMALDSTGFVANRIHISETPLGGDNRICMNSNGLRTGREGVPILRDGSYGIFDSDSRLGAKRLYDNLCAYLSSPDAEIEDAHAGTLAGLRAKAKRASGKRLKRLEARIGAISELNETIVGRSISESIRRTRSMDRAAARAHWVRGHWRNVSGRHVWVRPFLRGVGKEIVAAQRSYRVKC